MAHPDGEVRRERRGNVLVITIDRSDKVNSFTPKMMGEFVDALEELELKWPKPEPGLDKIKIR